MVRALRLSILLWVFFLPISISITVWDRFAYSFGHFSPWAAYMVNISDFFFLVAMFMFLATKVRSSLINRWKNINAVLVITCIALFVPFYFARDFVLHFMIYIKVISLISLFLYCPESIISRTMLANTLLISFLIQALLASVQFVIQGPIWLNFLGEPHISPYNYGIAKIDMSPTIKVIRPYWTMQHSNILWISSLIAFFVWAFSSFAPLRYILIIPIIISFSRTAWIGLAALIVAAFVFKHKQTAKKILFWAITMMAATYPYVLMRLSANDSSVGERIELAKTSLNMLASNLEGIGLGNFILRAQDYTNSIIEPWNAQPVHNAILLLFNETWIFGFLSLWLLVFLIIKTWKSNKYIKISVMSIILIIACFDHFFLTSTIWLGLFVILLRMV